MAIWQCGVCGTTFEREWRGRERPKYCSKACEVQDRGRRCGDHCKKCRFGVTYSTDTYCDYNYVTGHSRGCSIPECEIWKEHPKDVRNVDKAMTVKKTRRKKPNKAAEKQLIEAIMGGKHEV